MKKIFSAVMVVGVLSLATPVYAQTQNTAITNDELQQTILELRLQLLDLMQKLFVLMEAQEEKNNERNEVVETTNNDTIQDMTTEPLLTSEIDLDLDDTYHTNGWNLDSGYWATMKFTTSVPTLTQVDMEGIFTSSGLEGVEVKKPTFLSPGFEQTGMAAAPRAAAQEEHEILIKGLRWGPETYSYTLVITDENGNVEEHPGSLTIPANYESPF